MKHAKNSMRIDNGESIRPCGQPKRYKLALLTFVGLLAPVYFVPPVLTARITGPRLFAVIAAVAVIVVLMTYLIMPLLKRVSARWLCEQPRKKPQMFIEDGAPITNFERRNS